MKTKLQKLFLAALTLAASSQKVGYQPHPRGHSCDICMDRRLEILELRSRRNRSVRGKQSFYEFLLR